MADSTLERERIQQSLEALCDKKDRLIETIESYFEQVISQEEDGTDVEKQNDLNFDACIEFFASCLTFLSATKGEIHNLIPIERHSQDETLKVNADISKREGQKYDKLWLTAESEKITRRLDLMEEDIRTIQINARENVSILHENLEGLATRWDYFFRDYKENRENDRSRIRKLEEIIRCMRDKEPNDDPDYRNKSNDSMNDRLEEFQGELHWLETKLKEIENSVDAGIVQTRTLSDKMHNFKLDSEQEIMERINELYREMNNKVVDRFIEVEESLKHVNAEEADVLDIENKLMAQRIDTTTYISENIGSMRETPDTLPTTSQHVDNLEPDSTEIITRVDSLEKRQCAGFSANVPREGSTHITDSRLPQTCFSELSDNSGNHYTPSTGIFTAPIDGVYVVNLTHKQDGETDVLLNVIHAASLTNNGGQTEIVVGETWTSWHSTTCSFVSVLRMAAGDNLFVRAGSRNSVITAPSTFSCYLINLLQ